jgi:hypothetical protein
MNTVDSTSTSDGATSATLNTWVALIVALLATFMGICKVKDDNIVQARILLIFRNAAPTEFARPGAPGVGGS